MIWTSHSNFWAVVISLRLTLSESRLFFANFYFSSCLMSALAHLFCYNLKRLRFCMRQFFLCTLPVFACLELLADI